MTQPRDDKLQRRTFLTLTLGWCSALFALGASEGPTFLPDLRVFLFREGKKIRAVSAVCTHLGCTVNLAGKGFHCPCHGSVFDPEGSVLSGPAPKPLAWFELTLSRDRHLVIDTSRATKADTYLVV